MLDDDDDNKNKKNAAIVSFAFEIMHRPFSFSFSSVADRRRMMLVVGWYLVATR